MFVRNFAWETLTCRDNSDDIIWVNVSACNARCSVLMTDILSLQFSSVPFIKMLISKSKLCYTQYWISKHTKLLMPNKRKEFSDTYVVLCDYFVDTEQMKWRWHGETEETSSPKGNDRSPESNVPRSNVISKKHINGPWKSEARNLTRPSFYACPGYQQLWWWFDQKWMS